MASGVETPTPLQDVLDGLTEHVEGNDHFEFYWMPYTTRTLTKSNNRVPTDNAPRGRFYTNLWERKMSKAVALREAQVWLLRHARAEGVDVRGVGRDPATKPGTGEDGALPPLYWAAFVLSGDWR